MKIDTIHSPGPSLRQCHTGSTGRAHVPMIFALAASALWLVMPSSAQAFWLLGFSSADTLPPGAISGLAGTGAQFTRVGSPAKSSFTPFLPHAGFRIGVSDDIDVGYRLCQVALPFSSVGPSLGGELDAKYRLTPSDAPWQVAVLGGIAYSYLEVSGTSKNAWSPGADLLLSHVLNQKYTVISELRYVYTAIPNAAGGSGANHLTASGVDAGLKYAMTQSVSLIPEMGLFHFDGRLLDKNANGIGVQLGLAVAFRF